MTERAVYVVEHRYRRKGSRWRLYGHDGSMSRWEARRDCACFQKYYLDQEFRVVRYVPESEPNP